MASSRDRKPHVPAGWVACWDDRQQEWFYADQAAFTSQWQAPTGTYFPPENSLPPYEQSESGGVELIGNDMEQLLSSQQDGYKTSHLYQRLPEPDTSQTFVALPIEIIKFAPPSGPSSLLEFITIVAFAVIAFFGFAIAIILFLPKQEY